MKKILSQAAFLLTLLVLSQCRHGAETSSFQDHWSHQPDRTWIGPEYWANRLQDWQLSSGRLECISSAPKRTLHILTRYVAARPGSLKLSVKTVFIDAENTERESAYAGFLIGAGDEEMDYRRRSLIHGTHGKSGGMIIGVNPQGRILVIDNEDNFRLADQKPSTQQVRNPGESLQLSVEFIPRGEDYQLIIGAYEASEEQALNELDTLLRLGKEISGNLALLANHGHYGFEDFTMQGSKLKSAAGQALGPVIGIQYTLHEKCLKLTAQLAPISDSDEQMLTLQQLKPGSDEFITIAESQIRIPGFTAGFRVEDWDDGQDHRIRVQYPTIGDGGRNIIHSYEGVIMADPKDKEEIVLAAFTGNSNSHGSIGSGRFDFADRLWFPHEDLIGYVEKHDPDLLFYSGDNVYEGRPTPPDYSTLENTTLDYLYKWYCFLWAHGTLTRKIPAVTIPDDHDVYHGNIWGAGGIKATAKPADGKYPEYFRGFEYHWQQDQGGYKLHPTLVRMVEETQTSHLPDAYDPEPVAQGIGVYFTNLNYGRISWAVLEDRKFKSAPGKIHPDYKIINGFSRIPGISGKALDSEKAVLLGERQLSFLRDWAADWKGVDMKVALSQSIFANLSTYPDTFITDAGTPQLMPLARGVIPKDYRKAKDMDSNGWPQSGRNRALRELRKGYALMVGGDQHLGSVIHHGIDTWEDAGWSLCVPSIANLWPRRWFPPEPGENHQDGDPLYTGRYLDGFGNQITVHAVSNPYLSGVSPETLHDRAPGYGIIKLNKSSQQITLECWPRYADPESFNAAQYPGWPVSFNMLDNYSRSPVAWLPPLSFEGLDRPPVVQVVNEVTGEIIYTLRIREYKFQAGVFEQGNYSLHAGEPGTSNMQSLNGLTSSAIKEQEEITIQFE